FELTVFSSKPETPQIRFTSLSARPLSPMTTLSLPATAIFSTASGCDGCDRRREHASSDAGGDRRSQEWRLGHRRQSAYRPWLRDEFAFRCVYCLLREAWGPVKGVYALDHFLPLALRPDLTGEYDNLRYGCVSCNLSKSNRTTPDPLTD